MAKPTRWGKNAGKRVWRRLRIEPYNPNARDADGDGIVQEGTAWERPMGTRVLRGSLEVRSGETTPKARAGEFRIVNADGQEVDYTPSYASGEADDNILDAPATGSSPLSDSGSSTLQERGLPSVREIVQKANEPKKDEEDSRDRDSTEYGVEGIAPSGMLYREGASWDRESRESIFFTGDAIDTNPPDGETERRRVYQVPVSSIPDDVLDIRDPDDREEIASTIREAADLIVKILDRIDNADTRNAGRLAWFNLQRDLEGDDEQSISRALSNLGLLRNAATSGETNPLRPGTGHMQVLDLLDADGIIDIDRNSTTGYNLALREMPDGIRLREESLSPPTVESMREEVSRDREQIGQSVRTLDELQDKLNERTRRRNSSVGTFLAERYGDREAPWLDPNLQDELQEALENYDKDYFYDLAEKIFDHDDVVTRSGMRFRTEVRESELGSGTWEVNGDVMAFDEDRDAWTTVGRFERIVDFDSQTAENKLLTIGSTGSSIGEGSTFLDKVKGQGFAPLFNGHAFTWLKALGIRDVELSTGWDGPYVWPRAGFRLRSRGLSKDVAQAMEGELSGFDNGQPSIIANQDQAELIRSLISTAYDMEFSVEAPQNIEYMTALDDGTESQKASIRDFFRPNWFFPRGAFDLEEFPADPREISAQRDLDLSEPPKFDIEAIKKKMADRQQDANISLGQQLLERYGDGPAPWDYQPSSERIVQALSDLDEDFFTSWGNQIYGLNQFVGRNGTVFRTRHRSTSLEKDSPPWDTDEKHAWTYEADILVETPDGWARVGSFERVHNFINGVPDTVVNEILTLRPHQDEAPLEGGGLTSVSNLSKQGFASALNGQAFTFLKNAGFKSVSLDAAWDGPYVWPRAGFRTDDSSMAADYMLQQLSMLRDGWGADDERVIRTQEQAKLIQELVDMAEASEYDEDAPQSLEYMLALEDGTPEQQERIRRLFTNEEIFAGGRLDLSNHPSDPRQLVPADLRPAAPGEVAPLPAGFTDLAADRPELTEPTPPRRPYEPSAMPLSGAAQELATQADGDYNKFLELLDRRGYVVLDYETTGFDVGNVPIQVGVIKVKDGEVIGRLNLFMNPESPLSEWSLQNLRDANGNLITQQWLMGQRSLRGAHEEVIEFIGDNIVMAHNIRFDQEVLERTLAQQGLNFQMAGHIDTLSLLRQTVPRGDGITGPERHTLGKLAEFFGVNLGDRAHTADADAEATNDLFWAARNAIASSDALRDTLDAEVQLERFQQAQRDYAEATEQYRRDLVTYAEDLAAYRNAVIRGEDPQAPIPDPATAQYRPARNSLRTEDEVFNYLIDNGDDLDRQWLREASKAPAGGDSMLASIYSRQGFDALPQVVDTPDDLPEGWWLYRGLGSNGADYEQVIEWAEAFRTGDYYPGTGVYGGGTYTSTSLSYAATYAHPDDRRRRESDSTAPLFSVIQLVLRDDANILLRDRYQELVDMAASLVDRLREKRDSSGANEPYTSLISMVSDPGRLAALMGYDAYQTTFNNDRVMVVLNRSAVSVARRPSRDSLERGTSNV